VKRIDRTIRCGYKGREDVEVKQGKRDIILSPAGVTFPDNMPDEIVEAHMDSVNEIARAADGIEPVRHVAKYFRHKGFTVLQPCGHFVNFIVGY
jgi:hypothetical protein